jgi:hypothetical protein
MSSLLYIWSLYIHGAEPATYSASGVKIWHPPIGQAGRKEVRGGAEEWGSARVESFSSWRFHHLARLDSSMLPPCSNTS